MSERCVHHPDRPAVAKVGDRLVCADLECLTAEIEAQTVVVERPDE